MEYSFTTGRRCFLALIVVAGCSSANTHTVAPEDPLLLSRRPVERKEARPPAAFAFAEPVSPELSQEALAGYGAPPNLPLKANLAQRAVRLPPRDSDLPETLPTQTMPSHPPSLEVRGVLTSARPVRSSGGFAPDYSWVEGRLEYSRDGGWRISLGRTAAADPPARKLVLQPDARLRAIQPGCMVHIDGALSASSNASPAGSPGEVVYVVREVHMIPDLPDER